MTDDAKCSLDFILRRSKNKTLCSELLIKNRLCEIIYTVAETAAVKIPPSTAAYDTRIIKAKKYIEDNPHIFLTCDEVARYCNLSAKQLGRLFLQYENVSLLAFIHGQKIEDAKKLIRETDELFETISEKLGFSSVNYFGKFFTKHTGITPGDFRKIIDTSTDQ
jgi:AraC-like DNA-binding protein